VPNVVRTGGEAEIARIQSSIARAVEEKKKTIWMVGGSLGGGKRCEGNVIGTEQKRAKRACHLVEGKVTGDYQGAGEREITSRYQG